MSILNMTTVRGGIIALFSRCFSLGQQASDRVIDGDQSQHLGAIHDDGELFTGLAHRTKRFVHGGIGVKSQGWSSQFSNGTVDGF